MPRHELPYSVFIDYQEYVQNLSVGERILFAPRIRQIANDNGVRFQTMRDKILKLQKEFLEFVPVILKDEKGVALPKEKQNPRNTEIKFIPEHTNPEESRIDDIPNKWYQFGKKKQIKVITKDAETIPSAPVFLPGKTQKEFDKSYEKLRATKTEFLY